MPNSYFRFKQFTVNQNKSAMKVCTDACLFGAFVAQNTCLKGSRILDIGTGTGLLSLMLAQQNDSLLIDAVELDEQAAMQAKENFNISPWANRLQVFCLAIQQFKPATGEAFPGKYDFIISNPPFFENDLKSKQSGRNLALHGEALSLEELVNCVNNLLQADGSFAVLLPFHRTDFFEKITAAAGFCLAEKLLVRQTPSHGYFRSILVFTRRDIVGNQSEIIIQNSDGKYSDEFVRLLKEYYLYL